MASFNSVVNKVSQFANIKLKDKQIAVLEILWQRQSVFASLPTGYGKSEAFGLLPLMEGMRNPNTKFSCLVITPLKAITDDQLQKWQARGLNCVHLQRRAECSLKDIEVAQKGLPGAHLIFSSPEAIQDDFWWSTLRRKNNIKCLAVDEAHCLLTWGYGFRPDFLKVPDVLSILESGTPVLCLTGTACNKMIVDLEEAFDVSFNIVSLTPDRPNLHLSIEFTKSPHVEDSLGWFLSDIQRNLENTDKTIIFCRSVNDTGNLFSLLTLRLGNNIYAGEDISPENLIVEQFHSTSTDDTKKLVLTRFRAPESTLRCVVATVALGMGIDIPNVRHIIHWGPPRNVHAYWQECGRGGRDGLPSKCVLYRYPHSADKDEVDPDMQRVLQSALSNCCIRKTVLQEITVEKSALDGWTATQPCCCVCNP